MHVHHVVVEVSGLWFLYLGLLPATGGGLRCLFRGGHVSGERRDYSEKVLHGPQGYRGP